MSRWTTWFIYVGPTFGFPKIFDNLLILFLIFWVEVESRGHLCQPWPVALLTQPLFAQVHHLRPKIKVNIFPLIASVTSQLRLGLRPRPPHHNTTIKFNLKQIYFNLPRFRGFKSRTLSWSVQGCPIDRRQNKRAWVSLLSFHHKQTGVPPSRHISHMYKNPAVNTNIFKNQQFFS